MNNQELDPNAAAMLGGSELLPAERCPVRDVFESPPFNPERAGLGSTRRCISIGRGMNAALVRYATT